jgi:hypothetical protein
MTYGLKLFNPWGQAVLDENARYTNSVMAGLTIIPPNESSSPFIPLTDADNQDRFILLSASMFGPGFYDPIVGPSGIRFRRLGASMDEIKIDYQVLRVG